VRAALAPRRREAELARRREIVADRSLSQDAVTASVDDLPELLGGKYRVERVLGAGAMGTVYAATHAVLGQRVAIKRMHVERLGRPSARERFLREARAAARLRSEHVARVIDVGVLEDGAPFIVMEHLEGEDLAALLDRRGALPVAEAVEYVLQAAEAVAEAHAAGIVHRDLKPANLFLIRDPAGAPCVKVLDFGISKLIGDELALTRQAVAVGSPLYMSPEQMVSSKDVDSRTDLWSLGVVLYELVTASLPFNEAHLDDLYGRVLQSDPPPMSTRMPTVPAALEAVIRQCLQKDRQRRFPNAAELAAALAPFAKERGPALAARVASVLGVATTPVRATELLDADPPQNKAVSAIATPAPRVGARPASAPRSAAPRPRRGRVALLAGVAALLVAATILALALRRPPSSPGTATSTATASAAPGAPERPSTPHDAQGAATARSDRPK
jgi:serine/threonine-protein kinase